MASASNGLSCSAFAVHPKRWLEMRGKGLWLSGNGSTSSSARFSVGKAKSGIRGEFPGRGDGANRAINAPPRRRKVEDYNTVMKRMMRNPYEYHHDLGMNYTLITDNLIVGSQPQKPEDIEHLKEENVAHILCLQQDKDISYWGINFETITEKCRQVGVNHMRKPARDFDPDSVRNTLPQAVSLLEWAASEEKGKVYVHCTAGLGRAPAVAIAYLFWFCNMNLNEAYGLLTSKRPCGPNKAAIRGATYDLAKDDPWKEPFESLPELAFQDIADWERRLIQDRVRGLRGNF